MSTKLVLPFRVPDLIYKLAELYPEKCPNPEDDEREIWMKAGERRLVRLLLHKLKREEESKSV